MIRLEVLGKPMVKIQNREAKLYAKAVALLAYLALEGRTSRRKIAEMLWAGAPDALNNLSVTRGHILGELGETALVSDLETIALGANVWCDALEWQKDPSRQSWDLYRGEFLQDLRLREWKRGLGEEFEEWVEQKRTDFAVERSGLALALAKEALRSEQYLDAQAWLEFSANDFNEPHEEAVRWLICLYGFQNQIDKTRAIYSKLDTNLKETLGVCPTAQTQAAFLLARDGQSAECLHLLKQEFVSSPRQNQSEPLLLHTPFIGRNDVLRDLFDFLLTKPNTLARAVGIMGEPGAGKSRLALELARRLESHLGATSYFVKATPESPVAEPLAELCRALLQHRPQAINQLSLASQKAIQHLLPDLYPKMNHEEDLNHSHQLKNALQSLFATQQNTIIVFDDLQWADAITVQHLLHMLEAGLYLIFTQRNTEPSRADTQSLLRSGAKQHNLEPLLVSDLSQLLKQYHNQHWNASSLRKASGGNPLYALELLRSQEPMPRQVLHLIRERVKRLGAIEQQVLEGFAVLDSSADLYLLAKVTGRSQDELIEATERLEHEGLLGHNQHYLHLNHDLTKEAVLQDLGIARRAMLHLRAARALKMPSSAAQHYWDARNAWTPKDRRFAHAAFSNLANRYGMHGEIENAVACFYQIIETSSSDAQRLESKLRCAEWLIRYDNYQHASVMLEQTVNLLQDTNDSYLHAYADVVKGRILTNNRQPMIAKIHLEAALYRLEGTVSQRNKILQGEAQLWLGWNYRAIGELSKAKNCFDIAREIFQALNQQRNLAEALSSLATIAHQTQDLSTAEQYWRAALVIHEQLRNISGIILTMHNLAIALWTRGILTQAFDFANKAASMAEDIQSFRSLALAQECKGSILCLQHQYDQALKEYQNATNAWQRASASIPIELICNTAEVYFYLFDYVKALQEMNQFWAEVELKSIQDYSILVFAHLLSFDIHLEQNNHLECKKHTIKAQALIEQNALMVFEHGLKVRQTMLKNDVQEIHDLIKKYKDHLEYTAPLALTLATKHQQFDMAIGLLEHCTHPYWQQRIENVIRELSPNNPT